MTLIRLAGALALPILFGYGLVALIEDVKSRIPWLERFALAFSLGFGMMGLLMFLFSLFGMPLNLFSVGSLLLVIIVPLFIYLIIEKKLSFGLSEVIPTINKIVKVETAGWQEWAEKVLIAFIILTIGHVFFDALVKPILNFDDLWRQGCIAKIIYTTGKVITPQTLELAGPHPFLNPLSQAWIYMGIGAWNDALGKVVFALCFASLLFIFYSHVRKDNSRLLSLFFTYLLTSFPLIVYHAGTAYSDFMQTFYYSTAVIYLFRWIDSKETPMLYFSALLFGAGNFVKQSGIPLWGVALAILIIYVLVEDRKLLKKAGEFFLISFLVSIPWLFYPNSFLIRFFSKLITGNSGAEIGATSVNQSTAPALTDILYHIGRRMFTYADWQILWLVFILVVIFGWNRIWQSRLRYLFLIIIADLLLVIYVFFDPNNYQFLVDGTLVDRVIMYQIPVVLFFVALLSQWIILEKVALPPPQKPHSRKSV